MTWAQVVVWAIVEAVTEFWPVSSTAQLLLVAKFWPVANASLADFLLVVIQLGAILALVSFFWRGVWQHQHLWGKLIVAVLPAVILGLTLYRLVKDYLQDASPLTGWMLIGFGIIFSLLDWYWTKTRPTSVPVNFDTLRTTYLKEVEDASWGKMLVVGLSQSLALIPGVSRSGATIAGARAVGFSKIAATSLAFVLAIPTIAGAAVLDIVQATGLIGDQPLTGVWSGPAVLQIIMALLLTAGLSFWLAPRLLKGLAEWPFWYFGVYRVIIGVIWLALFYSGGVL